MTARSPVQAVQAVQTCLTCLTAVFSCGLLLACSKELPLPPSYEVNPDAKDTWEVVLTLHDAAPDVTADAAHVTYNIVDWRCLPPINNFAGIRREPTTHSLYIKLHRIDAATYSGIYFADGMLDKNYYGHGICRWSVAFVDASMTAASTNSFAFYAITARPESGTSRLYAKKNIRPFATGGIIQLAGNWTEEMYANVPEEERKAMFSFTLSVSKREDVQ